MRLGNPVEYTFMGHLQNVHYCSETIDEPGIRQMLQKLKAFGNFHHYTLPALYAIDYTNRHYLFVANVLQQMADYDDPEFLEGGLDFFMHVCHKDDFRVYNEKVFNANMQFLQQCPQPAHQNYIFTYTYRIKSKTGTYVHIWQRGSFITSKETGKPLFLTGTALDISAYQRDNIITHCIEKISVDEAKRPVKQTVASNFFYPNEEDALLTKQEKKCCNGWRTDSAVSRLQRNYTFRKQPWSIIAKTC